MTSQASGNHPTGDQRVELAELIARLEQATGSNRDLDGEIWIAIGGISKTTVDNWKSPPQYPLDEYLRMAAPLFTSSLDAALRVVPGWFWRAGSGSVNAGWAHLNRVDLSNCDRGDEVTACAATPELALCAAGLKARATTQVERSPVVNVPSNEEVVVPNYSPQRPSVLKHRAR